MILNETKQTLIDLTRSTCLVGLDKTLDSVFRARKGYAVQAENCARIANRMCRAALETGLVLDRKWRV